MFKVLTKPEGEFFIDADSWEKLPNRRGGMIAAVHGEDDDPSVGTYIFTKSRLFRPSLRVARLNGVHQITHTNLVKEKES